MVTYAKTRFGYDDSLDAFGVHGIGGIWGVLAVGIWATTAVNAAGANGLVHGSAHQLWLQLVGTVIVAVFSFVGSVVLFKLVEAIVPLRVSDHEERVGLDLTQHKEAAYTLID